LVGGGGGYRRLRLSLMATVWLHKHYQIVTRCSGGKYILSPSFTPNAS
jgi:hypothetical protein